MRVDALLLIASIQVARVRWQVVRGSGQIKIYRSPNPGSPKALVNTLPEEDQLPTRIHPGAGDGHHTFVRQERRNGPRRAAQNSRDVSAEDVPPPELQQALRSNSLLSPAPDASRIRAHEARPDERVDNLLLDVQLGGHFRKGHFRYLLFAMAGKPSLCLVRSEQERSERF
jgi:hypothetical protein